MLPVIVLVLTVSLIATVIVAVLVSEAAPHRTWWQRLTDVSIFLTVVGVCILALCQYHGVLR